jgi:hypothetical protein
VAAGVTSDHVLPFQRSMSGAVTDDDWKVVTEPTAIQNVADVHDTDVRDETVVFAGTGYGVIVQLVPTPSSACQPGSARPDPQVLWG